MLTGGYPSRPLALSPARSESERASRVALLVGARAVLLGAAMAAVDFEFTACSTQGGGEGLPQTASLPNRDGPFGARTRRAGRL
jgi:hypothetical protein